MKGKVLSTVIRFGGAVDGTFSKALNQAKSAASKAATQMGNNMKGSTNTATNAIGASLKSVVKTAVKVYATLKAVAQLKQFAMDCVTAAKAQLEVETKLETVLKNVQSIQIRGPNAAEQAAKKLKTVASNLQNIGVIGDEVTLAGMQQLATFQLSDKEISKLSRGMLDLLAQQKGLNASQNDAVTIGNMIGKAMSGNAGALSKVGISFSESQKKAIQTGDATLRAATIAEVLQQNVGGVNEALAKTDQGKIQQASNVLGDMKETLGMYILPILAKIANRSMPYIIKGFDGITEKLDKIAPIAGNIIDSSFGMAEKAIPIVTKYINAMVPVSKKMIAIANSGMPMILNYMSSLLPTIRNVCTLIQRFIPPLQSIISNLLPDAIRIIINMQPLFSLICTGILKIVSSSAKAVDSLSKFELLIPILVGLGAAFTAIKVINFATSLVRMTKSVYAAQKALAILRIAKLKDKAETIYLNALYKKDAIVKAASTVATHAQTVAMTAWNAACGIGTALTTALGAAFAFLTSPIGLVVLAIGAVIAIGVLLWKNWDVVKLKAFELGERIKGIFQSIQVKVGAVANWLQVHFPAAFAVISVYMNTWKSSITGVINGVKMVFSGIISFVKNVFAGNWAGAWNSIVQIFTGIFTSIGSVAKAPLNLVIGLVNKAISGINSVKGKINKIPGVKIGDIPSIPYLAKGATVTKPTLAVIGEKGPETVVPHNDKPRSRSLLDTAIHGVGSDTRETSYSDNASKIYQITYAPQINSSSPEETKKILDDEFEKFKEYWERYNEENEREMM